MQQRRKKVKKCRITGKRCYRDKVAAMFAVADAQHKDSSTRGKLEKRAYFHYACKSWHTTSMSAEEWGEKLEQYRAQKDQAED
jgi:hypothetical protein